MGNFPETSELQFQSPATGQVVAGQISIGLTSPVPASVASVEYLIGSQRISVASSAPFDLSWNTATFIADGDQELRAIARDSFGNEVSRCAEIFTIDNSGNIFQVTSPSYGVDYVGTVEIDIYEWDSLYWPLVTNMYIDGYYTSSVYTTLNHTQDVTCHFNLDTTLLYNGVHELNISFDSQSQPDAAFRVNKRGATIRTFTVANPPTTVVGIRSDTFNLELDLSETATMQCFAQRADGSEVSATGVEFSSDTPSVASIDSAGLITANAEGQAQITIQAYSRTYTSTVNVRANHNISHFGGAGELLTAFDAAKSLFVVSPFMLGSAQINSDSTLLAETKKIKANALNEGIYSNPRDITLSYDAWKAWFDGYSLPLWTFSVNQGFHFLFTGDDICRNVGDEAWYTLNWPSAPQVFTYTMETVGDFNAAIGVDVVDECTTYWGFSPVPQGKVGALGSFTSITCTGTTCTVAWPNHAQHTNIYVGRPFALRGSLNSELNAPDGVPFTVASMPDSDSFTFAPVSSITGTFTQSNDPDLEYLFYSNATRNGLPCNPFVLNDAVTTLSGYLHAGSTPISWPPLGQSPVDVQDNWIGQNAIANSISDYASHYWLPLWPSRTYPYAYGVYEANWWMSSSFAERQNSMDRARPQIILIGGSGTEYIKNSPGVDFNPPTDTQVNQGWSAESITSSIVNAAMLGCAGVRIYMFDQQRAARESASLGSDVQTGIYYEGLTRPLWRAVGYAAAPLTTTLQPFLLGTVLNSPSLGNGIQTTARASSLGNMLIVLNITDGDRIAPVTFGSLSTGQTITRYWLTACSLSVTSLPATTGDTVTLGRGECVVYLFPFSGSTMFADTVTFTPQNAGNQVLMYNYLYGDDLGGTATRVECTNSATVLIDSNIGSFFYQVAHLNTDGSVMETSSVFTYQGGSTVILPGRPTTSALRFKRVLSHQNRL